MREIHDGNGVGAAAFLTGLVCGVAIGAGVALLLAPESGKRTRKRLQRAAADVKDNATDRWDRVAVDVRNRVEEVLDGARHRFS